MAKLTEEQRQQRAQAKIRAAAQDAESRAGRRAARDRLWEKAGTRLSRAEFEEGVPCRGCGEPLLGSGEEPAVADDEQRDAFLERHGECGEGHWSVEGSKILHCSWCCPPPPMSLGQRTTITRLLYGNKTSEQSRQYDEWELVLTCGHAVRRRWNQDKEWSEKVQPCPICRVPRGVISSRKVGLASAWCSTGPKIPGAARSATKALKEFNDSRQQERKRVPSELLELWELRTPTADDLFRWRVRLDCGCVKELLIHGDMDSPVDRVWPSSGLIDGDLLPGEVEHVCTGMSDSYREIVEWGEHRIVDQPADPVEPPDYLSDEPDLWEKMRHPEPRTLAHWSTTLACGHYKEVTVEDLDWRPSNGSVVTLTDEQRKSRLAELDRAAAEESAEDLRARREHVRRMVAAGLPKPAPEQRCGTCRYAHRIVSCEPNGWLVPGRPIKKPKAKAPSRAALKKKLKEAEAAASNLRRQLAEMDIEA